VRLGNDCSLATEGKKFCSEALKTLSCGALKLSSVIKKVHCEFLTVQNAERQSLNHDCYQL
jgi:hypothetical protein